MENISELLNYLLPGAKYMISANNPDQVVWNDDRPMPTLAEMAGVSDTVAELVEQKRIADEVAVLEKAMHSYLESRYNTQLKMFLICAYVAPKCTEERKAAIESLWSWVESVVGHYLGLVAKLMDGQELTKKEQDWSGKFDAADPLLSLASLP